MNSNRLSVGAKDTAPREGRGIHTQDELVMELRAPRKETALGLQECPVLDFRLQRTRDADWSRRPNPRTDGKVNFVKKQSSARASQGKGNAFP